MLWVKSFHVVAIIAWMAGLLYLPRLLVYHVDCVAGSERSETFKIMERRLLKAIATPAMIVSWVLGLWLAFLIDAWDMVWFWAKLTFVLGLTGSHQVAGRTPTYLHAVGAGRLKTEVRVERRYRPDVVDCGVSKGRHFFNRFFGDIAQLVFNGQ